MRPLARGCTRRQMRCRSYRPFLTCLGRQRAPLPRAISRLPMSCCAPSRAFRKTSLGPRHPELANTLNNLAIVAEKTGRIGDAETFYRRAVAIASASPSPDDPMLAASRQNLEGFCRAQGLPIDGPAVIEPPTRNAEPEPRAIAREDARADVKVSAGPTAADSHIDFHRPRPTPQPSPIRDQPPAPQPTRSFAKIAIAIVFLVIAALFVMRPWTSRETSAPSPAPASAPTAPPASEPARPQVQGPAQQPSAPPAVKPAQPPTAAPRVDEPGATGKPRADAAAPVPITLVTAQLCRALSTSGSWQCEPAGDSAAPGPLVFVHAREVSARYGCRASLVSGNSASAFR